MIANISVGMISGASDAEISQAPTGAVVSLAGPKVWPGVNTQGVTHARLDFAIGGVIPLHTHPRAAETLLVLKGTIYTGFVSDDNVLYAATLQQGDVILFPKALLHFQLNVGNETAITFNTLTSQHPGLLLVANQVRIVLSSLSVASFCLLA
jgi:quercetin dioxygenase-like cupin family protein